MPINCLQPSPSPSSLCSLGLPLGGFSWKWIAFSLVQWYQKIDDSQHNNGSRYYKWCYLVNNERKNNNVLRAERFKLELKFLILNMNLQLIFFKDFLLSIQIIHYILYVNTEALKNIWIIVNHLIICRRHIEPYKGGSVDRTYVNWFLSLSRLALYKIRTSQHKFARFCLPLSCQNLK